MAPSKRARAFQELLKARGLDLQVVELPDSTRTADDAAAAVGCQKAQIVKSLVFRDEDDAPVLVLASGPNRVDEELVAAGHGRPIHKADAAFVRAATGYSIGGVPPIGHARPLPTYVDEDLLGYDQVWAAAGTPNAVFAIPAPLTDVLGEHTVLAVHR